MKGYKTISKPGFSKKIFKNSVFIGYSHYINSEEEAKNFINKIKAHHSDATHNVYAYIVENMKKYHDDGEPSGSAGKPILDILEICNLKNIVVVVSRYFGGTKLGYGGLVRAYRDTAREAIENGEIIQLIEKEQFKLEVPYKLVNTAKKIISQYNGKIIKEEYLDRVIFTISVKKGYGEDIKGALENLKNR